MIAVDTNVLVRFLVGDEPRQYELAKALFGQRLSGALPGFLSLVVIAETAWVLRSVYRLPGDIVRQMLLEVMASEQVVVEAPDIARSALQQDAADVTDWLIHLIGRQVGCAATVTFDRKFARQSGVELLA